VCLAVASRHRIVCSADARMMAAHVFGSEVLVEHADEQQAAERDLE
jgi:hypothetical protein